VNPAASLSACRVSNFRDSVELSLCGPLVFVDESAELRRLADRARDQSSSVAASSTSDSSLRWL
jgi:hypothetical protein